MAQLPEFDLAPAYRNVIVAHARSLAADEKAFFLLVHEAALLANLLAQEMEARLVVKQVVAEMAAMYDEIIAGSTTEEGLDEEAELDIHGVESVWKYIKEETELFQTPAINKILATWEGGELNQA